MDKEKEVKTKKAFYKKGWFIAIVVIVAIIIIGLVITNINGKKIDWSEIELGEFIPEPDKKRGEIVTNTSDLATIYIENLSKEEYKDYVQKCIESGYTIDLEYESWDTVYGAFNEDGYSIRISYLEFEKEMSITLETPEKDDMKEIEWPTTGLGAMLPEPKSKLGNISWDNSTSFIVHIGDTTIDDYNEYVKTCESKGFTNDYSKSDKSYSAYNSEGYKLHLMYLGANVIEISLKAPEETTNTNTSTTPANTTTTTTETPNSNTTTNTENASSTTTASGIREDFKNAMDSYETFMNEYVDFMKKYKANPTDPTLISQYSSMLQKYTEQVSAFDKWDSSEMSTEEASYYLEVQTRVNQKLLEVSQ